jgi:serine/threonine protein kinase
MFKPNDKFAKRYKLLELLGQGGFGQVWRVQHRKTRAEYALKVYMPKEGMDSQGQRQFEKEFELLEGLDHPNLLKPLEYDVWRNAPYLVMDYCPGGSLLHQVEQQGPLSEEEVAQVLQQIGDALHYMHNQPRSILHRDIKPDNILIDQQGLYRLVDFGISGQLRSSMSKSTGEQYMTPQYTAPERYIGTQRHLPASDIFSLGVSLFQLTTGELPWAGRGGEALFNNVPLPELPAGYTKRLQDLMQACLHVEAEQRPSAAVLSQQAGHFLREQYWPPTIAWDAQEEQHRQAAEQARAPQAPPAPDTSDPNRTHKIHEKEARPDTDPQPAPDEDKRLKRSAWLLPAGAAVAVLLLIGTVLLWNRGGWNVAPESDTKRRNITFGAQQVITTNADGVRSVYATDLDGDGDADVLSASRDDNKIAWYENQGGSFGPQRVITFKAEGALSVYATDLDGDGDADVLSASGDKIAWYENQGGGTFGEQQVITTIAEGAFNVYATDLDGDGDADVLSASGTDDKIAWYENQGGGSFGPQQVITTKANTAWSVYATDLDGDGDADVLWASHYGDKIAWYENQGGSFGPQQVITTNADYASSVYATDLDGDGDKDVLWASHNYSKIAWYENLGGGRFAGQQVITTDALGATSVYATDLDGDGDADVLSGSVIDDKIAWYKNHGGGSFGSQQVITTNVDYANSVYAADLDGDGDADVLSASSGDDDKITWYENQEAVP